MQLVASVHAGEVGALGLTHVPCAVGHHAVLCRDASGLCLGFAVDLDGILDAAKVGVHPVVAALCVGVVEEDVLAGPGGVVLELSLRCLDQVDLLAESADGCQQLLVRDLDGVILVVVSVGISVWAAGSLATGVGGVSVAV